MTPAGDVDPKPPGSFGDAVKVRANELGILVPASSVFSGVVELPTADSPVTGTVTGGSVILQEPPPILKFAVPLAYRGLAHPDKSGASVNLAPGSASGNVDVGAGGTLNLSGGEYFIERIELQPGADILVTGATVSNPCIVYLASGFLSHGNNDVNWNGSPRLLQIYGCDAEGDAIDDNLISNGSRVSCVWAGRETVLKFGNNVQFYGAADIMRMTFGDNCELVFDETLVAQILDGKPEWVLTRKEL
jgi:hypothetical protein